MVREVSSQYIGQIVLLLRQPAPPKAEAVDGVVRTDAAHGMEEQKWLGDPT